MDTATVMDIAVESLTVTTLVAAPILGRCAAVRFIGGHCPGGNLDTGNDFELHPKACRYDDYCCDLRRMATCGHDGIFRHHL